MSTAKIPWRLVLWPALALTVAALLWVLPRVTGPRPAPVDEALLRQMRQRWRAAGIEHYELEVRVSGAQQGRYVVEVNNGRIVRATFEDRPLDARRARYWTIPGQFGMLERELRNAQGKGPWPEGVHVQIWAAFDPDTGRPLWWQREVVGGTQSVTVRTVRFRILP